jgi:dual-specificity kinase
VSSFVQVLECWDREKEEMVAIKIIRGMKKYRDSAMIELPTRSIQELSEERGAQRL